MKERPIIFNREMVRAVLDGRKTQTRRPVKESDKCLFDFLGGEDGEDCKTEVSISHVENVERVHDNGKAYRYSGLLGCNSEYPEEGYIELNCPHGVPGDRLWVRETLSKEKWPDYHYDVYPQVTAGTGDEDFNYRGSDYRGLVPSIHMPRWASRILLEITDVRVERVQDISEADAEAEGVSRDAVIEADEFGNEFGAVVWRNYLESDADYDAPTAKDSFSTLWQALYGESWGRNDWVWVIEFKVVEIKQ